MKYRSQTLSLNSLLEWGYSSKYKLCVILIILLTIIPFSLGASSSQDIKIYPLSSDLYEAVKSLYIIQGYSLPFTSAPYSNDELNMMLNQIDKNQLPSRAQSTYDYVYRALHKEVPPFSLHADIALETYIHPNTTHFNKNEDWNYNYDKRAPFLSVPVEISLHNFFYARMEVILANTKYSLPDPPVNATSPLYGKYAFTTNFFHFWRSEEIVVDGNMPNIGFVALGGKGWTFELGKDKISWGPGTTGNLLVSDYVQYHTMGRFTSYNKRFKYTFLTSFFPHPDEVYNANQNEYIDTGSDNGIDPEPDYGTSRNMVGLKMFMAYRLEGRLFNDKVGIAVTEGIMYQSSDGTVDVRALNPFTIYHNYYIDTMANSIISLEVNYSPINSLNIYTQIALDDYNLPKEGQSRPNALGYMVGATYARPLKNGIFTTNVEGVYTNPYLYLRSIDGTTASNGIDSLQFVVAHRRWSNANHSIFYDHTFLGYPHGGDAIVANLSLGYKRFGKWSVNGNAFYMVHGEKNEHSPYEIDTQETTPTGKATHYVDIGVNGSYYLLDALEVYGGVNYLARITKTSSYHDVQLHMGIKYSL